MIHGPFYGNTTFYASLNNASLHFNGIKWYNQSVFYAIEVVENKVYKYDGEFTMFCQHPDGLNGVSNDLVLFHDKIFLSGQTFKHDTQIGDGQLWMCDEYGNSKIIDKLGRTNGIAIHPDGNYLYLSEAFNLDNVPVSNKLYKYPLSINGDVLLDKQLVVDFEDFDQSQNIDIDGIRFDVDNKIYISRNGAERISVFTDVGDFVKNYYTSFLNPASLEIGNKKMYVVGRCEDDFGQGLGCIDEFDADADGDIYTRIKRKNSK